MLLVLLTNATRWGASAAAAASDLSSEAMT